MAAPHLPPSLCAAVLLAVEEDDEARAHALLDAAGPRPKPQTGRGAEDGEQAAHLACSVGMPILGMRLLALGLAGEATHFDLLATAADAHDLASFSALAEGADRLDIMHGGYKAKAANDHIPCEVSRWAVMAADRAGRAEWSRARAAGLAKAWRSRPRMAYEEACLREGIPLWSAASAPPLGAGSEAPDPVAPSWAIHHSAALDIPCETLLWNGHEFEHWRQELLDVGAPARDVDALDSMRASHDACVRMLPKLSAAVARSRATRDPSHVEPFAKMLVRAGAQPWITMILAWADHAAFSPLDESRLAPLLRAAVVDERNVGMLAANWRYGSFNAHARVARVCLSLARMGQMSDGACVVLGARIGDLASDPRSASELARSSFAAEFASCEVEMLSRAEAIEIERSARAPSSPPRPCKHL